MSGGQGVSGGPSPANSIDFSQPLVLVLKQLEEDAQISTEELEEFVDELTNEILSRPPEYRFEKSTEVVKSEIIDRFGSEEVYASLFPASPEQFLQLLENLLEYWMQIIVAGVTEAEEDELDAGLVYLSAIATVRVLTEAVDEESNSQAESEILASSTIALYARIFNEHQQNSSGNELNWEAIIEDTLWAGGKLDEVMREDHDWHVPTLEELSPREGLQTLRVFGAGVLYDRSDASIGRGAEMAQVSQTEFRQYLVEGGIRPRLGPESAEEFYSDPDL